jgi:hypothetical protein
VCGWAAELAKETAVSWVEQLVGAMLHLTRGGLLAIALVFEWAFRMAGGLGAMCSRLAVE